MTTTPSETKLPAYADFEKAIAIEDLTTDQAEDLQRGLNALGYNAGPVDGLVGRKTIGAWGEYREDVFEQTVNIVTPFHIKALEQKLVIAASKEYDFSTKEGTMRAIKEEAAAQGLGLPPQMAYILATVQWETNHTYKPVREAYWTSENWRRRNLRYYPYYGRGYVQLTWRSNYVKYAELTGKDLANEPDLALEPYTALFVLIHGCKTGTFTGRKLEDYINFSRTDFINARRVINGRDKATEIASLAEQHLKTLGEDRWPS